MIHAFLLVVILGGKVQSQDMYFRSVTDCNYFASQITKRYGNYGESVEANIQRVRELELRLAKIETMMGMQK